MTDQKPLTEQQLTDIETRANAATPGPWLQSDFADFAEIKSPDGAFIAHAREDVPALLTEVRRLRAVLEQIRHLHKDSPMGPCPVCIDADAAAAGGDGLVPYPCPTARLAGATDCDPPHVRAAATAEGAQR